MFPPPPVACSFSGCVLSQNRLLKWYSAIDEMLDHKDEAGFDPSVSVPDHMDESEGHETVIVRSKIETQDEQAYVL